MFRKESIFSSKGPMLKNEFGVEVGGIGVWMGVSSIGVVFCTHPTPLSKTISCTPPPPQRRKEKEPNKLPRPSFETTPPTPLTKNAHAHAACSTTHSHSLSLFFLHLPSSPSFFSFLNYLTFDINITQLHLHLHLHFSLFSLSLHLPFSFFSLSLSSFVFLSEFFLWIVSLSQWIGGGCLNSALDQPPPPLFSTWPLKPHSKVRP